MRSAYWAKIRIIFQKRFQSIAMLFNPIRSSLHKLFCCKILRLCYIFVAFFHSSQTSIFQSVKLPIRKNSTMQHLMVDLSKIYLIFQTFKVRSRKMKLSASVWFKFCEISQNFSSFGQLLLPIKNVLWMTWNFEWFHEILNQTNTENFSFLSSQTKKNIPKKT